jgi:alkyl hydroperoxide reductase subunit AhpC
MPPTRKEPGHLKLTPTYQANVVRNLDEIIQAIDALQLSGAPAVSTPLNWR